MKQKHISHSSIFKATIAIMFLVAISFSYFHINNVNAGTFYGTEATQFEKEVKLTTQICDDTSCDTILGKRENFYIDAGFTKISTMGKPPLSINNVQQGDELTVNINVNNMSGNPYTSVLGKGVFFAEDGGGNVIDISHIIIPGTDGCTAKDVTPYVGSCSYDNGVITFINDDDTQGTTLNAGNQGDYTFTFRIGEEVPENTKIYLRLDYVPNWDGTTGWYDDSTQTNDLNITNHNADPDDTNPDQFRGHMNFQFDLNDASAPELYLKSTDTPDTTTTVGIEDSNFDPFTIEDSSQNTINHGFNGNYSPDPGYWNGSMPPDFSLFNAGVIFDNQITLNTKAMFQDEDPDLSSFRDDKGIVIVDCNMADPTNCSSIDNPDQGADRIVLPGAAAPCFLVGPEPMERGLQPAWSPPQPTGTNAPSYGLIARPVSFRPGCTRCGLKPALHGGAIPFVPFATAALW